MQEHMLQPGEFQVSYVDGKTLIEPTAGPLAGRLFMEWIGRPHVQPNLPLVIREKDDKTVTCSQTMSDGYRTNWLFWPLS